MVKKNNLKVVKSKAIDSELLKDIIIKAIQEKKGREISTLDLRNISNSLSDFFVICHGDSDTQIRAIADSVQDIVYEETGEKADHIEGTQNFEWVLIDYFSVIVHVFNKDRREYYGLERLWADASIQKIAGNY